MRKIRLVMIVCFSLCALAVALSLMKIILPELILTKRSAMLKEFKPQQQTTKITEQMPTKSIEQDKEIPQPLSPLAELYNNLKQKIDRGAEPPEWIEELVRIQEIVLENDIATLFELIQLIANEQHPGLKMCLTLALGISKIEFVAQSVVKLMEQDTTEEFWLAAFHALALDPEKLKDRTSRELFFKALFLHPLFGEWVAPEYYRKETAKLLGVEPELIILPREYTEINIPEERIRKSQEFFSRLPSTLPDPLYEIVGMDYVMQAMGKISNDKIIKQLTDLMKRYEPPAGRYSLMFFDPCNETFQENFVKYYLAQDENPYRNDSIFMIAASQLANKDESVQQKLQKQAESKTDPNEFLSHLLFAQQVSDETLIERFIAYKGKTSIQAAILVHLMSRQKIDILEKLYTHDDQLFQNALTKGIEQITFSQNLPQNTTMIAEIYSRITNYNLRKTIIDALANVKQKDRIVDLINKLEAIESDPYLRTKIQSILKK